MSRQIASTTAIFLAALSGLASAAQSPCEAALNAIKSTKDLPLPAACAKFGPLQLGMTLTDVEDLFGLPDITQQKSDAYRIAWYVYPRDYKKLLANSQIPLMNFSLLSLVYSGEKLVAIDSGDNEMTGLDHDVFRLGRHINDIRKSIKLPIYVNRPRDYASAGNVPFSLSLDEMTGRVSGLRIAIDMEAFYVDGTLKLISKPDPTGLSKHYEFVPR